MPFSHGRDIKFLINSCASEEMGFFTISESSGATIWVLMFSKYIAKINGIIIIDGADKKNTVVITNNIGTVFLTDLVAFLKAKTAIILIAYSTKDDK
jgi:hypothetical protein